jgi:ABC-type uncharacterized transport system permease subunit
VKVYEKVLPGAGTPLIVGFDIEWTKNYQMKNANKAFCFSLVSVQAAVPCDVNTLEQSLAFGFVLGYAEAEEECQQVCLEANRCVSQILSANNIVVGHQFSSDVSVLLACSQERLPAIETLQQAWRTRLHHMDERAVGVFDTRYDLPTSKDAASNKLVNVCPAWRLIVTQPEIKGSMTRMQREFYQKQTPLILEQIAVLNLRHSLSSILLYLFSRYGRPTNPIDINTILFRNLHDCFAYVRSERFAALLTEGASDTPSVSDPLPALALTS